MSNKNFKYICLFLTILLVLVGLGSLSATDIGDNTTTSSVSTVQADNIQAQNNIETVSEQPTVSDQSISTKKISETKTVNKEISSEKTVKTHTTKTIKQDRDKSDVTTYNGINQAINQDNEGADTLIINLQDVEGEQGTVFTSTQTITINNQPYKTITMNGNGHTIDANGQQFLNIANGYTVTLKDLTITNAKSEQGGAIENSGSLTLINVTFTKNTATNYGGAVYSSSESTLNVQDSAFNDNTVTSTSGYLYNHGGAAITAMGETVINNTTFTGNTATHNDAEPNGAGATAGAVLILNNTKDAVIANSTFTSNNARYGGAITVNDETKSGSKTTLDNNVFTSNSALYGGAVMIYSPAIVNNSVFTSNYVDGEGSGNRNPVGGAIDVFGTNNVIIDNSAFSYNQAGNAFGGTNAVGGAIAVTDGSDVKVTNSKFTENYADKMGGAIYNDNNITVDNSTFEGNYIAGEYGQGGAIQSSKNANATISNSNFTANEAFYGGALISFGTQTVTNSIFTSNTGNVRGAAIYTQNGKETDKNNTFTDGFAGIGGAIYNAGSDVEITDSTFDSNTAYAFGGAIYSNANGKLTVNNSTLTGNVVTSTNGAAGHGGAAITAMGETLINNSKFNNNVATHNDAEPNGSGAQGGAILILNNTKDVTVANSTFDGNTARYGGAIQVADQTESGSKPVLDSNVFVNNTALYGGAIQAGSPVTISNSNFTENTVKGEGSSGRIPTGGAISVVGANDVEIVNDIFTSNTADDEGVGGAISSTDGSTISIDNSTFTSNTASSDGGAVYNDYSNLELTNSEFTSNTAAYAGALSNYNGNQTIVNNTFTDNSATEYAGAIDIENGDEVEMTNHMENNTFTGNNAPDGGALYVYYTDVTVKNNTFTSNSANYGGAIYNNEGTVTIEDSKLDSNTAQDNGGAIYSSTESALNVENSTFSDNTVTSTGGYLYNHGGAAITTMGETNINHSTFTGNTATHNDVEPNGAGATAGAILILNNTKDVTVANSTFDGNTARYGGAITVDDETNSGSKTLLDNNVFTNNTALYGGAIVAYSSVTINNSNFTDNSVNGQGSGDRIPVGGAIDIIGTKDVTIENSNFTNNAANDNGKGGAIGVTDKGNATINNSNFTGNTAGANGGAVYVDTSNATVDNSNFDKNTAASQGGAVLIVLGDLNVTNSNFTDNTARYGGAVISFNANQNLINNTFTDNTASSLGGAIYTQNSKETEENNTFNGNSALNGGAIYSSGSNVTITDSTINNNTATNFGGAIYSNKRSNLTVNNSTLAGNTVTSTNGALNHGGAAILAMGETLVNNTKFINNTASHNDVEPNGSGAVAGAIELLNNTKDVTIANSTFDGNTGRFGGAIAVNDETKSGSKAVLDNNVFTNNTALYGGAIIAYSPVTINNSNFTDNSVNGQGSGNRIPVGGAIDVFGTDVTIENSNFTNNAANDNGKGGAIGVTDKGNATINNSNFTGNTAGANGGAVYVDTSNATVDNSNFDKNTAANQGGATLIVAGNLNITNSNFTENTARYGGATISFSANQTTVNSTFTNNTASVLGGADYTQNGKDTQNNNTYLYNYALNGGAIYNYGSDLVINYTTLNNNSAILGGAIFINDNAGTLLIGNSTVLNNTQQAYEAIYNYPKSDKITLENTTIQLASYIAIQQIQNTTTGKLVTVNGMLVDSSIIGIANAVVTVTVNGEKYIVVTDEDGYFSVPNVEVLLGSNTVYAEFAGSEVYVASNRTSVFNGTAHNTKIILYPVDNARYDENVNITGIVIDSDENKLLPNVPVAVTLNGKTYAGVADEYGYFVIEVPAAVGENNAVVSYNGNEVYNKAEDALVTFNGLAHASVITLDDISDVLFDEEATVTGTLTDVNGTAISGATVTVNGQEVTTDKDGKFTAKIAAALGLNNVVVSYDANENYNATTATAAFNGLAHNTAVTVNPVDAVKFGETVAITGVLTDVNGTAINGATVTITVNGKDYTDVTDVNGSYTIRDVPVALGDNSITVNYNGNNAYNPTSETITVTGLAHNTTVTVDPVTDAKYDDTVTITGKLLDGETAVADVEVIVTVNGKEYVTSTDATGTYTVNVPVVLGSNDVTVNFAGNDNYNGATAETSFNGLAHNTTVTVDSVADTLYDNTVTVTGILTDVNGTAINGATVTVTVNGKEYITSTEQDGSYTVTDVPAVLGLNTVAVSYESTDAYNGATAETSFNGLAHNTTVTVDSVADTLYDNTVTVTGILTDVNGTAINGATVTVTVNGKEYIISTEQDGSYTVTNVPVVLGLNTVTVSYESTDAYNGATAETSFNGLAHNTTVTVDNVANTKFGETVTVTGKLTDANNTAVANAVITVTVNGEKYTTVTDNTGVYTVTNVPVVLGRNNVIVTYNGDDAYNSASTTSSFNGIARDSTIVVNPVSDALYGNKVTITGLLYDENNVVIPTAIVYVTVNGQENIVVTDEHGIYSLTNVPVAFGTNTVVVSYAGNGSYNKAVNVQTTFNGLAHDTIVAVNNVDDIEYGETVTVTGLVRDVNNTLIPNAIVTVTVNGQENIVVTDKDGVYTLPNVPVVFGTNTVVVSYNGNASYIKAADAQTTFNGLAHDTILVVNPVSDALFDDTVAVTGLLRDANNTLISGADVTVTVNGVDFSATTDADGVYNVNVPVSLGRNTVVVSYNGNASYNDAANAQTIFNGLAHSTTLTVNAISDALFDETVSVTGKLADANSTAVANANVNVVVNGVTYNVNTDADGLYTVNIPVAVGVNTVAVTYNGNSLYNKAEVQTLFNGLAHNTTVSVDSVNDTLFDETVSVTGKLADANSTPISGADINIIANGITYTVTSGNDGIYTVNIPVAAGVNNVVVTYNGNNLYNKAEAQTSFNGLAHDITITVDPINDTLFDETVNVTGKIADANSTPISGADINVIANGITYTVTSGNDGIYTVNIPVIAGVNNVVVSYGNSTYKQANATSTFNGLAHSVVVTVDSVNTTNLTNVVITGKVNDANTSAVAGANITATINGVDYNTTTDANGTYTIDSIQAITGTNNVVITFNGNDVYNTSTVNTTFTGYKYNTTVTVDPISGVVYDDVSITAHIIDENNNTVTGGYVIFKVNGVTIKDANGTAVHVDVINGTAALNTTATNLNLNTTTVVYSGNSVYNPSRANGTVDVAKRNATINLTVLSDDLKPGHELIAVAHVTDINGTPVTVGKVTFKLNGVTLKYANGTNITVDVINGTAILNYTIPSTFSAKTYNLSAVFGGDVYNRVETSQNITLNRIDSYIEASNTTLVDNVLHVRATLRNNETKEVASERPTKVSVKIDGKTVIKEARILDGVIDLNTTVNVKSGNHTVEIVTSGNNVYKPVRTNITVTSQTTTQVNNTITSAIDTVNNNQTLLRA